LGCINTILDFYRELGGTEIFNNPRFKNMGDQEMIYPRLQRVAINQLGDGPATLSRYGIWASTIRDILLQALEEIDDRNFNTARERIIYTINSLGAFIDIQAALDSYQDRMGFYEIPEIIKSYSIRDGDKN
jgi:hypothetical protein